MSFATLPSAGPKRPEPFPRGLAVAAFLVVILWGVAAAREFLIPLCLAALLAFVLLPVVRGLCRLKVPDFISIALGTLLLVLPFLGIGYLVVQQGQSLAQDFPTIVASLQKNLTSFAATSWGQRLHVGEYLDMNNVTERIGASAGQGLTFLIAGLGALLNAGSQVALIVLFAILMLASRRELQRSVEHILQRFENIEAAKMLEAVTSLIERFLIARLTIVAIVALVSAGALKLFGLRYSFILGCGVGLMTLVPAVGFIVSLVPVAIVSLATGHSIVATIGMIAALVFINILEGNVLTPKLVGQRLNLNTLATMVGLLGGGLIWGLWGMLLSVPILGVLRIALSAAPSLQPWGELLAEREDKQLTRSLIRRRQAT